MKASIEADDTMKTVPAVQNGRIIALTEKYRGSTSHYMAKAVEELAGPVTPICSDSETIPAGRGAPTGWFEAKTLCATIQWIHDFYRRRCSPCPGQ